MSASTRIAFAIFVAVCAPCLVSGVPLESGDLLVTDLLFQGVLRTDPTSGDRTVVTVNDFTSGIRFSGIADVAVDRDGSVLVSDARAVIRVDPLTGQRTVVSIRGVGASQKRTQVVVAGECGAVGSNLNVIER